MKIVIAMDSFKGSLTSMEAGNAVKAGIEKVCDAEIVVKPAADGGEGTTEALVDGLGGKIIAVEVTDPLGRKIQAVYGILPDGTAVMEMAQAAGITLVKEEERDALSATTYGVGEMIRDAIQRGYRRFLIGIGGSATSDGGVGMLQALGYRFLDSDGKQICAGIKHLDEISTIESKNVLKEINECYFSIACDVKNPLLGKNGAVYVYGPQKGIQQNDLEDMERKMSHFAEKTTEHVKKDYRMAEGAGAAGGLGFAFFSYIPHVEVKTGIEIVLDAVDLEKELPQADYVVTGEGQLDGQTVMGKTPVGVAELAKKYGKKVIAFAGSVTEDAEACNRAGIDAFFPIIRGVTTVEEALKPENAKKNIERTAEQVFRLLIL